MDTITFKLVHSTNHTTSNPRRRLS